MRTLEKTQGRRSSNIECLRIVCMLFIIAGHLITWHQFKSEEMHRIVRTAIHPFFMISVDCFVLISGWFGISFVPQKIYRLNNTVMFWAYLLCIVALCAGLHVPDIRRDILMIVPLATRVYWFITVYVALCILAPFINIFIDALSKVDFRRLLIICTFLFVILPSVGDIFNFESLTLDFGYGIVNFVVLYMFGRYMRLYEAPKRPAWVYFVGYLSLMIICGVFQYSYSSLLGFEFTTFISYDSFFVFFGAIALFCGFVRLDFYNKYINILASACFAVYIIHIHPWIGGWTYEEFLNMRSLSDWMFLFYLIFVPGMTYVVCFILDKCRMLLFECLMKCHKRAKRIFTEQLWGGG